jgi:hypothetical protein
LPRHFQGSSAGYRDDLGPEDNLPDSDNAAAIDDYKGYALEA